AIARATGIPANDPSLDALQDVHVPGRMERFTDTTNPHVTAYVDYAHNQASVTALLDYIDEEFAGNHPRITLVTGAAGNKAYDRREGMVRAAQNRIERLVLTSEDTDTEPMEHILDDIDSYVTNPDLEHVKIVDRTEALENAIEDARADAGRTGRPNIILAIGKGREKWIKHCNKHVEYEGDIDVIRRMFGL
ncbi:glutamate ligase domain-containing protein, partial [Pseudoscardovia radai]|uniref:glutamate ligase domain-containing protein n=1 Tax=Pseudoscardovia radai TaxID=987066 RepID=UPI003994C611